MEPEWSGEPEVNTVFAMVSISGLVAFAFLVWVFAFYW
jgi:hypothetical protein